MRKYLVPCGTAAVAMLVILLVIAVRMEKASERVMQDSIERSLKYVYDESLKTATTMDTNGSLVVLPSLLSNTVISVLNSKRSMFPSFITIDDIYITADTVALHDDDILVAVRVQGMGYYGITANKSIATISTTIFDSWNHRPVH